MSNEVELTESALNEWYDQMTWPDEARKKHEQLLVLAESARYEAFGRAMEPIVRDLTAVWWLESKSGNTVVAINTALELLEVGTV